MSTTAFLAGGIFAPQKACTPLGKDTTLATPDVRKNWAGNYTYTAKNFYEPKTATELQALVKKLSLQKALGSTHCFNDIADNTENQISTRGLNKVVAINKEEKKLTVEAGARYGDFSQELHEQGFALHNLASLPHITVAGACSTATHGSGVTNGNLATAVHSIELVRPSGELVTIDKRHPDFNAVVVGLGAFGIITKVTLNIQNTFDIRQDVFLDLPLASLDENFDEIMSSGYSVSLFTNWLDSKVSEVWVKRRMDAKIIDYGNDFYGAKPAMNNIHPIVELDAANCSDQMGVPGPWYDRLPHFKMGFMPSAGEELQAEFFVPRKNAVDAILAIEKMKEEVYPVLMISEIRTIAADEFWMSPCYHQDSIAIHFTFKQMTKEVMALIPKIEAELAPFQVKPHWGKLFTIDPKVLQSRYERYEDFVSLINEYDPDGKFKNPYLTRNL